MTPKELVRAEYPAAQCVMSDDNRCCFIIITDAACRVELGESHGGRGRAWRDAALKMALQAELRDSIIEGAH